MKQPKPILIPVDLWVNFEFAVIIKTTRRAPLAGNRQPSGKVIWLDKQRSGKRRFKFIPTPMG
jgi:hypothetical protein